MEIVEFLKKAADKTGFKRERYIEKNIPTNHDNIVVFYSFDNIKLESVMSSFLVKRIKSLYPEKYFIFCSRSGCAELYPYVDEYWGYASKKIDNQHIEKELNKFFENVVANQEYYKNGFSQKFFDEFKDVVCEYVSIPSSSVKGDIFIYPSKSAVSWGKGKEIQINTRIEFWHELVKKIIALGMHPVIYQNSSSYDLSPKFESTCSYCLEDKAINVLGCIRSSGLVLDVFNGISRYANLARTPFLCVDDRQKYNSMKEWELDVLWKNFSSYIFSFPTILESGYWDSLIKSIINRLKSFRITLNKDNYFSTSEQSIVVPYKVIEDKKIKKLGMKVFWSINESEKKN